MVPTLSVAFAIAALAKSAAGHASIYHPSMWGFNVTQTTMSYDNRPVVPLYSMNFDQWWFHNHLAYPPHSTDFMEFPAGGSATMEISCDKGYTSYYASSPGGDNRDLSSNLTCPGQPTTAIHANNQADVAGCAIAIAYKSDINDVQPEDFAIFTVNYMCPWFLETTFQIPADMPACPEGGCICAWNWIHKPDSGAEQIYMNGFQCKITGQTGNTPIGTPGLARRCGADPDNGKPDAVPSNCTVGPVQPFYWYQNERNNMFEGTYSPPLYNALYGFTDGAQPNLFQNPTIGGSAAPAPPAQSPTSAPAQTPSPAPQSPTPAPSPAPAPSSAPAPAPPPSSEPAPASSPSSTPEPAPSSSSEPAPVPPPSPSTVLEPSTSVVAPTSSVAVTATPNPTQQCKRRDTGDKKRTTRRSSPVERHIKKRLTRDSTH